MGSRWMRAKECAEYTQLSVNTIRKYVIDKRMPYCKVSGCIVFDRQAIDKWIEDRAVPVIEIAMKKFTLSEESLDKVMGQ